MVHVLQDLCSWLKIELNSEMLRNKNKYNTFVNLLHITLFLKAQSGPKHWPEIMHVPLSLPKCVLTQPAHKQGPSLGFQKLKPFLIKLLHIIINK